MVRKPNISDNGKTSRADRKSSVIIQKSGASNSVVQVGRDYVRYLQLHLSAGDWGTILVNVAFLGLALYGLASGARSVATYALDMKDAEGICSARMQRLALAFSS